MNREILFRGKGNLKYNDGVWYYGYLIFDGKDYQIVDSEYGSWRRTVVSETVGQYTGLKDKNGTKIFEGDIVKTDEFNEPNKLYVIKYDEQMGAFIGDNENFYFVTFDGDSNQFELMGNVYDNPELLIVGKI